LADLITAGELPKDFTYPREFVRVVELGLTRLDPWWIIQGDVLRGLHRDLRERYPTRELIPFAKRRDNDDIACWEAGGSYEIVVIHDFASPGWEDRQRRRFPNFNAWFRQAIEDLIEFES
jgi:hypothetical protein